jgi:hypothetical protein
MRNGVQIFIDYKQAYDRVNITKLINLLRKRKIPEFILRIIYNLLAERKTSILLNGHRTIPINVHQGLVQGSLLSPLLWNIYIDEIAQEINGSRLNSFPKMLLWADDLRLQFPCVDAETIQEVLDLITKFDLEHELIPSISKCAIMLPDDAPQDDWIECHYLKFHHETLPVVYSYKYVGLEFNTKGCDILSFFQRSTTRAYSVLNALKHAGMHWTIRERLHMFQTFSLPIPMYGGILLYLMSQTDHDNNNVKQALELLDLFINEGVRWILSSSVANKSERALLGLVPTEDWLHLMTLKFKKTL